MLKIDVPAENAADPFGYVASRFAKEIIGGAMGYSQTVYQHSTLSLREFEAARIRTSHINGCQTCQTLRAKRDLNDYFEYVGGDADASVLVNGEAPDDAFYAAVADWKSTDLFSEREKLAIEFAEGMGQSPQQFAQNDALWERIRAAFSENEIVDLTYSVASWIALGRSMHVLGLDGVCAI